MNSLQQGIQVQDFLHKAKEFGLLDEFGERMEQRKYADRLALITEMKALPTEEEFGLVDLGKACNEARRQLDLAEEALLKARQKHCSLTGELYGKQHAFYSKRNGLENQARNLAPVFITEALRDLGILESHVRDAVQYNHQHVKNEFIPGTHLETTSNSDAVGACLQHIWEAKNQLNAMVLEPTPLDEAKAQALTIFRAVEAEAYSIGVSRNLFQGRREPVDQQAIDRAAAPQAAKKRSKLLTSLGG